MISPIAKAVSLLWSRNIFQDIVTTSMFTILGRSLGFFIPFLIAAWYGIGGETDAFFFAYGTIFFLCTIFSSVLASVVVPFVAEAKTKVDDQGRFIGSLLVGSGFGILFFSLIFMVSGYPLFRLITGFSDAQLKIAYILSLETLPIFFLVVWSSLLGGVLNAHQVFGRPQLSLGMRSTIIIILIFCLKDVWGIHAIPAAYVLGEGARSLFLFFSLNKVEGVTVKFILPDRQALKFFKTASVQVVGIISLALFPVMDKSVASWLGVGSVSLLDYADKLFFLPLGLFAEGLFVVLLSYWSRQTYNGQSEKLKSDVNQAVRRVLYFAIPVSITLFIFRYDYANFFYGRGAFPQDKIRELSQIAGMYILGLPLNLASALFGRGLLVLKNTPALAKVALGMLFLKIFLNFILYHTLGLPGLALSTSLVYGFSLLGTWFYFNNNYQLHKGDLTHGISQ
jgi:putative peptidoglycan lipid II flippase